jgi:hypothetical protein
MNPRARRWTLILGALLGLVVAGRVGWVWISDGVRRWFDSPHSSDGWSWRLWGARRRGGSLDLDSARIQGPGLDIVLRRARFVLAWTGTRYQLPLSASIQAGALEIGLHPSVSKDTSAPAFPRMQIPLQARIEVDSLSVLRGGKGGDRMLARLLRVEAVGTGPEAVRLSIGRAESPGIPASARLDADAEWTESDTLRARVRVVGSSGCCASDTARSEIALWRRDLRMGRFRARAGVEESRGWSDVVPALARIPALHGIDADVEGWSSADGPGARVRLSLSADSLVVLPPMDWDLDARISRKGASLLLSSSLPDSPDDGIDLRLEGGAPRFPSLAGARATGAMEARGVGMWIAGFDHPFDSRTKILSIDRNGASIELTTAAGSVVQGQAQWKGLHWSLDGRIAPGEPWAVAWVDSLRLAGGGHAKGRDSAGSARFDVVAYRPGIRMVRLDSLSTRLRLSLPGPRLEFADIVASDSTHAWNGTGRISIPDSLVEFGLRPAWDSSGYARLVVKIGQGVDIRADDFPTRGLPLDLPFLPSFPMRADATLRHGLGTPGVHATTEILGSLRGRPLRDSLHLGVALSIGDSALHLRNIRASVGSSSLEANLAMARGPEGWLLDTLEGSTSGFELADLKGVAPSLPSLRGLLVGRILSHRGEGVAADLRLGSPALSRPEGDLPLPDLLLWGERDTLHLGGWWPLAGQRAPFRITATRLWEPSPEFDLVAFWGDVLKVGASARFEDRKRLRTSRLRLEGSAAIPGTEIRLRDLLVDGSLQGDFEPSGFAWRTELDGSQGILQAVAGNPLSLRFKARADKDSIRLLSARLADASGGVFDGRGGADLRSLQYWADGLGKSMRFDLGGNRVARLDTIRLTALPDSRILLDLAGGSYHQAWSRDEFLDLRVPRANLALAQAKDWRKLSGEATVDRLLFTRNFAEPGALLRSTWQGLGGTRRRTGTDRSTSSSTLLDLRITSAGDSILFRDNLGQARLRLDLQVAGPADAPLLNGFFAADTEEGHFGYLGRNFHIDTLRLDWNTQPAMEGRFQLAGFRSVRRSCQEGPSTSSTVQVVDSCRLSLSALGTLENPRMRPIRSDCATLPGDDGTVGSTLALATGCYPQQSASTNYGSDVKNLGVDVLVDYGKDWVNEFIARQVRRSRASLVWIPDSVAVTDIPTTSQSRDQLGLMALYHITPELDAAGIYQHTFAQSATALGSKPVLSDNYGLSLQYRIPFRWIDEPEVRTRLENRVFLQCDLGEALDDNLRRATVVQPSLRYRWEFW